ncbi:MAG TPA: S-layer homology domain-containing protein [Abditibacteriaceae bacterium]|jgi:hypothetical protein
MMHRLLQRKNFILGSALALTSCVALSSAAPARAQSVFSDVPDNHWAAAAVKRLAEAGIIEGRSGTPQASSRQASALQSNAAQAALRAAKSSTVL